MARSDLDFAAVRAVAIAFGVAIAVGMVAILIVATQAWRRRVRRDQARAKAVG